VGMLPSSVPSRPIPEGALPRPEEMLQRRGLSPVIERKSLQRPGLMLLMREELSPTAGKMFAGHVAFLPIQEQPHQA
jgi:hypothetical protein